MYMDNVPKLIRSFVKDLCLKMLCLLCMLLVAVAAQSDVKLTNQIVAMEVGKAEHFQVDISMPDVGRRKMVTFISLNEDLIKVHPNTLAFGFDNSTATNQIFEIGVKSRKAGKSAVSIISISWSPANVTNTTSFLVVQTYKSEVIEQISNILGWGYFLCWSVSFYPQIYTNYRRRSVIGLSFDFNWFNLYGYFIYNAFNIGMYYSPTVQEEFSERYPNSINPVHLNDIVFSLHSFVVTLITICQCYCYERGNQKLSTLGKIVLVFYCAVSYIFILLAFSQVVLWLDVVYAWSYLKLTICVTKWVPQIYMNYQRKSTHGFSMGSIALDFAGGIFSILQMVLDSINYDDWNCVLGNPTKLGLGVLSILFDLAFVFQHYITWDHGFKIRTRPANGEDSFDFENPDNMPAYAFDNYVFNHEGEIVPKISGRYRKNVSFANDANAPPLTSFKKIEIDVCTQTTRNNTVAENSYEKQGISENEDTIIHAQVTENVAAAGQEHVEIHDNASGINYDAANQDSSANDNVANQGSDINDDVVNQGSGTNVVIANQGSDTNNDVANQGNGTNDSVGNNDNVTNDDNSAHIQEIDATSKKTTENIENTDNVTSDENGIEYYIIKRFNNVRGIETHKFGIEEEMV